MIFKHATHNSQDWCYCRQANMIRLRLGLTYKGQFEPGMLTVVLVAKYDN